MTRPRDSQRSKVYEAEWAAQPKLRHLEKKLPTVPEMQEYVDKLLAQKWTQRHFGHHRIRVTDGRGQRKALAKLGWTGSQIGMPKWSRTELVILHEVAHHLTWGHAWHGWQFCAAFLKLVRHQMGVEAHDILKAEMKARRVKMTKPRKKRKLTPEQKAELTARLRKANEARAAAMEEQ